MARATPHKRSTDAPLDAIALLKQDHRAVEALFDEFEDADESEQSDLATRICQLLTVHTQIEEEYLYPQAKDAFDEDDDETVYEAEIEHGSAKELIAKIEAATPEDPHFKPLVMVLLGGIHTVGGPMVGGAVYKYLAIMVTSQVEYWKLVLGGLIVVLVVAFPQGIGGFFQRHVAPRLGRRGAGGEEAEDRIVEPGRA